MKMFCTFLVAFVLLSGFTDGKTSNKKKLDSKTTNEQTTTLEIQKPSSTQKNKKLIPKSRDEDVGMRQEEIGTNFAFSKNINGD